MAQAFQAVNPCDWLDHASRLLIPGATAVDRRRAISASYYALFHALTKNEAISPHLGPELVSNKIRRAFIHGTMKGTCELYAKAGKPDSALKQLAPKPSNAVQAIARRFIDLYYARQTADYDLAVPVDFESALEHLTGAAGAIQLWMTVAPTPEGREFWLALLLGKSWNRSG